jgi:hypothetical protein
MTTRVPDRHVPRDGKPAQWLIPVAFFLLAVGCLLLAGGAFNGAVKSWIETEPWRAVGAALVVVSLLMLLWKLATWLPLPSVSERSIALGDSASSDDYAVDWANDEIRFYIMYAHRSYLGYRLFTVPSIIAAAAIPIIALVPTTDKQQQLLWTATLGAFVTICQSIVQSYRFRDNWLTSVETRNALVKERELFVMRAGHYHASGTNEPGRQLAVRVSQIVAHESDRWSEAQREVQRNAQPEKPRATEPPKERPSTLPEG